MKPLQDSLGLPATIRQMWSAMSDLSQIDHDQFHQLLDKGHSPEEAAQILLESRRAVLDVCQRLLDQPTDALQRLLEEFNAQEATDESKG